MIRWLLMALVLPLVLFSTGQETAGAQAPREFAPGEVLVKFKPGTPGQAIAEALRQNRAQEEEIIRGINVRVVGVPSGEERASVERLRRNPNVEFAELNGVYEAIAPSKPNDSRVDEQWQYNNTGQTGGTADADIDAYEAWSGGGSTWDGGTTGSSGVPIAILDTGIKEDHADLQGKVTKRANFTDSSTNGDVQGHGTHVAGSAGAVTNNGTGVAGTCPGCTLYNVKVLGDTGNGYYSWIASGMTWATDNGAKVINMSLGGTSSSATIEEAVNYAWSKGVVVIAAAGNSGTDSPVYPAYYTNVVAVAATNHNDAKASWSNYGGWVDVAAPGASILSTTVDGGYGTKSGTSMATPHVAGIAGLAWSKSGLCDTNTCVRDRVENMADQISGTGTYWARGRINASKTIGDVRNNLLGDTIGVYRKDDGQWYLNNSNKPGQADISVQYGSSTYLPVTGDWDGSTQ